MILYLPGVLFGTAPIGEEYIPGSNFLPNGFVLTNVQAHVVRSGQPDETFIPENT